MSIWKDVPGVLTGDPRLFDHMTKLETLSYGEAIEMTYYGAQVIHPKTIRPLQNKQIPLKVKSFVDPAGSGTTIQQTTEAIDYPPMIVVKNNQTLLKITSKDFYFVDESKFSKLFQLFASHRIKVNMTQNTALAFSVCVNANPEQIKHLTIAIDQDYILETIEDLKLVTLRYPNQETIDRFDNGRKIYLEEKIRNTVQLVIDSQEVL
jgi:aspartate kinase